MTDIKKYVTPGINKQTLKNLTGRTTETEKVLLERLIENFSKVDTDGDTFLSQDEINVLAKKGDNDVSNISVKDIADLVQEAPKERPPVRAKSSTVEKSVSIAPKAEPEKPELVRVIQPPAESVVEIRNTTNPQLSLFGAYLIGDDKDDQRILFSHNVYGRIDLTRGKLTGDITQDQIDRAGVKVDVLTRGDRNRPFAVKFTFTKPGVFVLDGKKIVVPGIIELWDGKRYAVTDDGEILSKPRAKKKTLSKEDLMKEGGWQGESEAQVQSNIRLNSSIPAVVKGGSISGLSNDYISAVNSGLASVPRNIQDFIKNQGYTVVLTTRLVDSHPNKKPNDPSGFENTAGITCGNTKEIVIAESIFDTSTRMYVKGFAYEETTRHELGHAYIESSILKNLSLIQKLHEAYEKDLEYIAKNCNAAQKRSFSYLLPAKNGASEKSRAKSDACAEVFASLFGGGLYTSDPVFNKAFSNLIKCIQEEMIDKQGKPPEAEKPQPPPAKPKSSETLNKKIGQENKYIVTIKTPGGKEYDFGSMWFLNFLNGSTVDIGEKVFFISDGVWEKNFLKERGLDPDKGYEVVNIENN